MHAWEPDFFAMSCYSHLWSCDNISSQSYALSHLRKCLQLLSSPENALDRDHLPQLFVQPTGASLRLPSFLPRSKLLLQIDRFRQRFVRLAVESYLYSGFSGADFRRIGAMRSPNRLLFCFLPLWKRIQQRPADKLSMSYYVAFISFSAPTLSVSPVIIAVAWI